MEMALPATTITLRVWYLKAQTAGPFDHLNPDWMPHPEAYLRSETETTMPPELWGREILEWAFDHVTVQEVGRHHRAGMMAADVLEVEITPEPGQCVGGGDLKQEKLFYFCAAVGWRHLPSWDDLL